jgi:hypothetical protein
MTTRYRLHRLTGSGPVRAAWRALPTVSAAWLALSLALGYWLGR